MEWFDDAKKALFDVIKTSYRNSKRLSVRSQHELIVRADEERNLLNALEARRTAKKLLKKARKTVGDNVEITEAEVGDNVEKRWPCQDCGKAFKDRSARYHHRVSKHGHKPASKAKCPICGSKDRNQSRHLERHHKEQEGYAAAIAVI